MNKISRLIFTLILLTGCGQSLALLGPASTSVTGGNLAQSALSSAVSFGVKKQTGKSPMEHAMVYAKKHNPEMKKSKCIEFIDATRSEICEAVKEYFGNKRVFQK